MTNYRDYLQTPQWYATRARRLDVAGNRCEFTLNGRRCTDTRSLNVHHRNYQRLGAELDGDLEVLCRLHHLVRHMIDAECEVCGASLVDDDEDALELIATHQREHGAALPSLVDLGLKQQRPGDVLLCWHCEEKLSGDD